MDLQGRRMVKSAKVQNVAVALVLASQLLVPVALAEINPAVELQGAIAKEQVDGDLKTAIAIYKKIAADTSAPRDMRAKALLHLARCYEKLGQQAQTVYRQIVSDFGDQPEAAQARARLAVLKQKDRPAASAAMTQRKIDIEPNQTILSPWHTDGQRAIYLSRTWELIYGDLAGKSKRVIFKPQLYPPRWVFPSRNLSMVLLAVDAEKPDQRGILAVLNTDGTGYREIAHVDVSHYEPLNWSWDERYVLVSRPSLEGTKTLVRVSIADGQIRELLSPKTGNVISSAFSPDGRFVAYEVAPSEADHFSRIFVQPAEGGESKLVYEERQATPTSGSSLKLLDWTADGRHLAIASERTGKSALHLVPTRDGKSAGEPVFVIYGNFEQGVTTASGGLVYSSVKPGGLWAVYLASLDSNGRLGEWKNLELRLGTHGYYPAPRWSGDSNQFSYIARSESAEQNWVVHLHSLSTGEDREVYHAFGNASCVWAVQQPKLFCMDTAEKTDIFSIAVDSGEIAQLRTFPKGQVFELAKSSPDGLALYMSYVGGKWLRWEIATGQDTITDHVPPQEIDARWLIRWTKQSIAIHPVQGGDWRPLVLSKFPINHFSLTPDGNWLLYHDVDSVGKDSLFRVATVGGTPERLGIFPTDSHYGNIQISPDGSKILVSSLEHAAHQLWLLENFVPPAPKR
jgi:hypothetical protein